MHPLRMQQGWFTAKQNKGNAAPLLSPCCFLLAIEDPRTKLRGMCSLFGSSFLLHASKKIILYRFWCFRRTCSRGHHRPDTGRRCASASNCSLCIGQSPGPKKQALPPAPQESFLSYPIPQTTSWCHTCRGSDIAESAMAAL